MTCRPGLLRALLAAASLIAAVPLPAHASALFSQMVVFGDSLSDNGNFAAATGGILPPSTVYPGGRFSNGQVAVEYLAGRLGLASSQVRDYATGGALTGYDNLAKHDPALASDPVLKGIIDAANLPGMRSQVDRYTSTSPIDPHALYVVWGGANDLSAAASNPLATPATLGAAIAEAVTNLGTITQQLILGGAQHVLVAGMPNLGLTPSARAAGADVAAQSSALAGIFNTALNGVLDSIDLAAPGRVIRFDTYGFLDKIVSNAAGEGLDDVAQACLFTACAATPSEWNSYLFWDAQHPTTRGHELIADGLYDAVVPEPSALALSVLGVAMLGFSRRSHRVRK
ncbi:SGNH/GDSL hydrolase family protein [Niveibacterium sp.]|uniref:SGNH/GDSL hydrolase family protein n=1 Tax=Niveibacterium sp. TaxID=2017444 RepID=UPI0035B410B1